MELEFLGTGGSTTTPRFGCSCERCQLARKNGAPYSRWGPSLFIHGPDVLIDTPEEISFQLSRSGVSHIRACFYSHWHPDHVMGRRLWEFNKVLREWPLPTRTAKSAIYVPAGVARDFQRRYDLWNYFSFFQEQGLIDLNVVEDSEEVSVNGHKIAPFVLGEPGMYGFRVESNGCRALIVPDELRGWTPPANWCGVFDVAVLPVGVFEFHPLSGERIIGEEHPVLRSEATFQQTLEISRKLNAKNTYLTHIEEVDPVSYEELTRVAEVLKQSGTNVQFAHDTLRVHV